MAGSRIILNFDRNFKRFDTPTFRSKFKRLKKCTLNTPSFRSGNSAFFFILIISLLILFCIPFNLGSIQDLDLSASTIIVYNTNSPDSYEIAEYYADARGIGLERLCPVQLPPGQFATAEQFMGARKTIIEECICDAIEDTRGYTPVPCDTSNLDQVSAMSPISHMVLIRGIPARLFDTGWPTDGSGPSFDYYLSATLYDHNDLFDEGTVGQLYGSYNSLYYGQYSDNIDNMPYDAIGAYTRPLDPGFDRIVAYGRVEAMTKERTSELIDRTIDAEQHGFKGNMLTGLYPYYNLTFPQFIDLTSSFAPECTEYISNPALDWPYQSCRAGISADGQLPGEEQDTLPRGIYTGIWVNHNPINNGQAGFDNFNVMTNWHKSDYDCTELCQDFAVPADEADCRIRSTDYFKEINTDCVGAAPGLIGFQLRSFPVQYYGFWPPGWSQTSPGTAFKTPPYVISGGGYQDENFTDEKFLRFGGYNAVTDPKCTLEDGSIVDCPEEVGVNLRLIKYQTATNKSYLVRFRYRNQASPGAYLRFQAKVRYIGNTTDTTLLTRSFSLIQDNSGWQTAELMFNVGSNVSYSRIYFDFFNWRSSAPAGHVDLDAFEIYDLDSGVNLCKHDQCTFNASYVGYTIYGDYAANAIDRLGGIAWWGSSSHHLTGGGAFGKIDAMTGAFFSGRTLGESLARTGKSACSGIIYGDPLYRPSAAKIFLDTGLEEIDRKPIDERFTFSRLTDKMDLYINAFHGQDNIDTTRWELSVCTGGYPEGCLSWSPVDSGIGAVYEHLITDDLMSLVPDNNSDQEMVFRLRVWNPGEEENELFNHAYINFKYIPQGCTDSDSDGYPAGEACGPEIDCDDSDPDVHPNAQELCNGLDDDCDGIVDEGCYGEYCKGDFDHDGDVDGSDLNVFGADYGRADCENCVTDCEGDFDCDGDVDGSDLNVFSADYGRVDCPICNNDGSCNVWEDHESCPNDCPGDICSDADEDKDGVVDIDELLSYINQWKSGGILFGEIVDAIDEWKSGC